MKVTFLSAEGGDWIWMFVDNKLVKEGHSLRHTDALDALGVEYQSGEMEDEYAEGVCHISKLKLSDLDKSKYKIQ